MDNPKDNLAKSKSSNSANTTRSDSRSNKKSRSSVEFQTKNLKKRGMYVEKKTTKLELNTQTAQLPQKHVKPPPRPRPGKKRFLTSVFSILSKSIASTQFPECDDDNIKKKERKPKHKKLREDNTEQTQDKHKYKYRSRVLNDSRNDTKKVVIIKPRRDIIQTPSESCYDQDSSRWLNLPRFVKADSEINTMTELQGKIDDLRVDVATNVTDGRRPKEKKVVIVDKDPKTLVSEETKEKGMYNFFVDLLETTFNVYNVKPEYNTPPSEISASKVDFVIEETVAKKLNLTKENKENKDIKEIKDKENNENTPELINDITQKPIRQQYLSTKETNWHDRQIIDIKTKPLFPQLELLKRNTNSRRMKSKSFAGNGNPLSLPRATLSTKHSKKNRKKDLLNILKDELSMDYNDFEEPQNLFQALQLIARNKRKCKKSIRFDKSALKTDHDSGDPECTFKRRNIMLISRKSTKKNRDPLLLTSTRSIMQKPTDFNKNYNYRKKYSQPEYTTDLEESNHTLKVYDVQYNNHFTRLSSVPRDIILPYDSSPSTGNIDFKSNETFLRFSDSGTSSFNLRATGSTYIL